MRTARIALALIMLPVMAAAQEIHEIQGMRSVRENLARPDSVYGARAVVEEKGSAQINIRNLDVPYPERMVKGYRVCIFTEKSQKARENAFAAEAQFKGHFPDVATYVLYDKSSNWKVMTGNCLTMDEVTILQGKAEKIFPSKPYIVNEEIPVSEFGKKGSETASAEYLDRLNPHVPEEAAAPNP